jgi:hypothetical protein
MGLDDYGFLSERAGIWMARRQLPEETRVRLLQCPRWGVWDEGTATIGTVELTTLPRCQRVASKCLRPSPVTLAPLLPCQVVANQGQKRVPVFTCLGCANAIKPQ